MGLTCGGDNLGKMAKNCMKITESTFFGQNNGGWMGREGQANFLGGRENPPPPSPPPLGETLLEIRLRAFHWSVILQKHFKNCNIYMDCDWK